MIKEPSHFQEIRDLEQRIRILERTLEIIKRDIEEGGMDCLNWNQEYYIKKAERELAKEKDDAPKF